MFSKELEALIEATLQDGVLEENEKAVLARRAEKEGVDLAELEVYINSLLQKRQQEANKQRAAEEKEFRAQKKESLGRVCPNCGRPVPPMTLKCECGYEFATGKAVSSVQLLNDKLNAVTLTQSEEDEIAKESQDDKESKRKKLLNDKRADIISTFPVPNTKEDIIEFLSLSAPNAKQKGGIFGTIGGRLKVLVIVLLPLALISFLIALIMGGGDSWLAPLLILEFGGMFGGIACFMIDRDTLLWNKMAQVWRAKFDQVMMKGRSMRGDAEFQQQLDYYEGMLNKK